MLKNFSKERMFYIFITILIAIIIFLFSDISFFTGEETGFNLASFYHFGVFFMFTFFLSLSLKNGKINIKLISIILLVSLSYAISDEFHQLFVPGRFASVKDVLIDLIGGTCAVLTLQSIERFKNL